MFVVFIRKHATPPLDLISDYESLLNGHPKLAETFSGGVMDVKLFFFEKSSFMEVYLDVNVCCVHPKTRYSAT